MAKTLSVTDAHRTSLATEGYTIFPKVLESDEVKKLRKFCEAKLSDPTQLVRRGNSPSALFDIFGKYPETRWLLYHRPINDIVRSLLGETTIVNLRATAVLHQKSSPWHNETTEIEAGGYDFMRSPDCKLLQTVVYLQDNSGAYGAALDLDKGTHLLPDPFIDDEDYKPKDKVSLELAAGDLLVFDWRLAHRATPCLSTKFGAPIKLGVFGSYTNKQEYADLYNEFSNSFENWPYLHNFSYPQDLVAEARSHSIIMA